MPIRTPGKRPFAPWLKDHRAFSAADLGRRHGVADLLLTPLIDMFVILVVFLIMNFSSTGDLPIAKDILLPKASVTLEREEAPAIDISSEAIIVDGVKVGDVDDVLDDPDLRIPKLTDRLHEMRKDAEMTHPGEAFAGNLIINSHKDMDFKLIRKVMFAARDAGYINVNFAVLQTGGGKEEDTDLTKSADESL